MHSTKRIVIDLLSGGYSEPAHVVQGDAYSRTVELDIRQEKTRWTIPNGLAVVVEYHKPDGTKGVYDTLPDGTRAWSAEGNILTLQLAPQMLTAPGTVVTQVRMMKGDAILSLFKFHVFVHQRIAGGISEDYMNLNTFLPQVDGAKVGQYFKISEVDDAGRATKVIAVDAPQGGVVDIPTKLPNPHALVINGTAYDGSEAVSVEIPQGGGGGSSWRMIASVTLSEDAGSIEITKDSNGNAFELVEFAYTIVGKALGTSGNVGLKINDTLLFYSADLSNTNTTAMLNSGGHGVYAGKWVISYKAVFNAAYESAAICSTNSLPAGKMKKFWYGCTSGAAGVGFQAGTVLELWGR